MISLIKNKKSGQFYIAVQYTKQRPESLIDLGIVVNVSASSNTLVQKQKDGTIRLTTIEIGDWLLLMDGRNHELIKSEDFKNNWQEMATQR